MFNAVGARIIGMFMGLVAAIALAFISANNPMDTTAWLLVGGTLCAVAALVALVYVILSGRRDE